MCSIAVHYDAVAVCQAVVPGVLNQDEMPLLGISFVQLLTNAES